MQVSYHTKIKHWLLDGYLKIYVDAQKRHKKPIVFVDLFSGDGYCECKDTKDKWDGSPLIAAKRAKEATYDFKCIFNDKDPNTIKNLNVNLNEYKDVILDITEKDANKIYPSILSKIDTKNPCLFFLDPLTHSQLKWETVKGISKHTYEDSYYNQKFIRRPELLINLMTYTMQKDYQQHPEYIDAWFGNKNWIEKVNEFKKLGLPVHKAFLEKYLEQLQELYGTKPSFVEVSKKAKSVSKGGSSVLYYLIFVYCHPKVQSIFESYKKYVSNYIKTSWIKEYARLKGFSSLTDYSIYEE